MDSDRKSEALLDRTIEVWQTKTSRTLTHEDARTIVENATGFFALLLEWERRDRHDEAKARRPVVLPTDDGRAGRD